MDNDQSLLEIARVLWGGRVPIIACGFIFLLLALGYRFFVPPYYESSIQINVPHVFTKSKFIDVIDIQHMFTNSFRSSQSIDRWNQIHPDRALDRNFVQNYDIENSDGAVYSYRKDRSPIKFSYEARSITITVKARRSEYAIEKQLYEYCNFIGHEVSDSIRSDLGIYLSILDNEIASSPEYSDSLQMTRFTINALTAAFSSPNFFIAVPPTVRNQLGLGAGTSYVASFLIGILFAGGTIVGVEAYRRYVREKKTGLQ